MGIVGRIKLDNPCKVLSIARGTYSGLSKYVLVSLGREEIIELKGEENWGRGKGEGS